MIPETEIIELSTFAAAKVQMDIPVSDTKWDVYLAGLIQLYSREFAREMDRYLKRQARTEYFKSIYGQRYLWLPGWPISVTGGVPVLAIYNSNHNPPVWSNALIYQEDYEVFWDENGFGKVEFIPWKTVIYEGPKNLKVVYTGGMAADTAGFATAYPALVQALLTQVQFHYQLRDRLAVASVSEGMGQSVSYTQLKPLKLLDGVKEILQGYKRFEI